MNHLPKHRFKIATAILGVLAAFVLVWYGVVMLQRGPYSPRERRAFPDRGMIVDRNGKPLAMQTRLFNVEIDPAQISRQNLFQIAEELSVILDMNAHEIENSILAGRYFTLRRRVSVEAMELIEAARREGRMQGVFTIQIPARVYPERSLAGQIIGFVGDDYRGLEGIEHIFNRELSGQDSGGRGSQIVLTIDVNVQHILERVAESTLRATGAEAVLFMAMDPRTGDILGSAVVPGFDPNNHREYPSELYRNMPAFEPFEPGSVMKVFSVAALMDMGVISPHTTFICNGFYERVFPGGEVVRIECPGRTAHGRVGPREIITLSCNVGASYAAGLVSVQAFYQSLINFGFGNRTGAWANAETAGFLREPRLWSGRSRQSIAFGQEIAASALQIMQAASVIANDGILVPPRFVSRIVSADGTSTEWENELVQSRRVIRPETAQWMRSYMADTATIMGTGWRAGIEDITLAVKTGTAQIADPITGRYSDTDFLASCIALLPAENPSLALFISIVRPQGETFGGRIAAPAIREAAELLIDYLGIPRGRNPAVEHPGTFNIAGETLPEIGDTVPGFGGLSKRTLLPLLDRNDIRVDIRGEGWVARQSPPPGTAFFPGMMIVLELE